MSSFNWSPLESGGSGGVTTINSLSGDVILAAGSGISIASDGLHTLTISSTSAGDVTLGTFGSTPNTKGASLSAQVLTLQPADGTNPGGVSATTQTFGGNKTFTGTIAASNLSGTNTGDVTLGTANGLSLVAQALSLALSSASTTGALSSTDWNTFNGKQAALTIGNLTAAGTDGIAITSGTGAVIGSGTSIAQHVADSTHNGYLSSTDWSTFNNKGAGSVTSVDMTVPTFLSVSGNPITGAGTLAVTLSGTALPVANGGTGVTSLGNLTAAGTDGIAITTGTGALIASASIAQQKADASHNGYLSSADWSTFNGKGAGTVTSVAMTVPSFLSIAGTPITGSGTLALTLSGTALPVANGGTGLTSGTSGGVLAYTASGTLASSGALTAHGVVIGGGAGAAPTSTGAGSSGQVLKSNGSSADPTFQSFSAPTVQKFTSGSAATYTLPAGVLYIRVRMSGGGGAGTGSTGNGGNGNNTTFGTSLLTANGGGGGNGASAIGGTGGAWSIGSGPLDLGSFTGGGGAPSHNVTSVGGGQGGSNPFGGGGRGGGSTGTTPGQAGSANTGAGGGGAAGVPAAASNPGGGAGGYIYAQINSPASTYTYTVGTGGTAGTGSPAGGAGADGIIIVEEYYY